MKRLKEQDIPLTSPLSYVKFIDLLKELDFYTIWFTYKTPSDFIEKLEEVFNGSGGSMCSSYAATKIMPTSSSIVRTMKEDAVANTFEQSEDLGGTLDELLGFTTGPQTDGGISAHISKITQDVLNTLKSEEGYGCEVIKLEVYPFNQVCIFLKIIIISN